MTVCLLMSSIMSYYIFAKYIIEMVSLLTEPTLVLNKHWQPISTSTVREAICLVSRGSAKIIEPDTYAVHDLQTWEDVSKAKDKFSNKFINSACSAFLVPEVILLTAYTGGGDQSVVFSRHNIFKRDKNTCQYCGVKFNSQELTIDHIIPRSRGGISSWTNCVLACVECNQRKDSYTLEEAKMKLLKVPKKPTWKTLMQGYSKTRLESWDKFLDFTYWHIELEE